MPNSAKIEYADGKIVIEIFGVNKGVSRIYLPYKMKYEIKDSDGKIVKEMPSSANPRNFLPDNFAITDTIEFTPQTGKKYYLSLRIYHTHKIFNDFKFAAKELNSNGSLNLGEISR